MADIMEKQDYKCALTGWDIMFPETGHPQEATASIDRIDSSLGYTKDNIQIVHRDVNMMKSKYSQEHFIAVCCAVATRHGEKW